MLPTLVCAQTPQERLNAARAHYAGMSLDDVINDGLRLYQEGKTTPERYEQALDAFIYAQSLDPSDVILIYNIAKCYHRLGNCEYALSSYEAYKLKAVDTDSYTDVSTYIDALRKQCGIQGTLVLRCTPQDALVSFDGNRLEPCDGVHKLKAGRHNIAVEREGYAPQTLEADVIYNEVTLKDVELKKDKAYAKTKRDDDDESLQTTSLKRVMWISGVAASGVGAAALIAGGGLMLGSRPDDKKRDDALYTGGIAVAGVGAAALAAGIVLLVLDAVQTDEEESQKLKNYKDSLAITPSLSFSRDGATAGLNIIF